MSRRLIPVFVALCVWSGGPGANEAAPAPVLKPFEATYTVTRGRTRVGEMSVSLTRADDGSWTYRSESRTTGLIGLLRSMEIDEVSTFRLDGGSVRTLNHSYSLLGDRRNRDFTLAFDWDSMRITGEVRGESVDEELHAGAVDRHTMTIAVAVERMLGKAFPRTHVMVDRGRVRELETRVEGEEQAGRFLATRIVQQRLDDATRRYVVWLARVDGTLVAVRVQSVDDEGATLTLDLTRISVGL